MPPSLADAPKPVAQPIAVHAAKVQAAAEEPVAKPRLTNFQRMRKIEETIEAIRPMLQRDHGDIEVVEIDGKNIYVNLNHFNIKDISDALIEAVKRGVDVRLAVDNQEYKSKPNGLEMTP